MEVQNTFLTGATGFVGREHLWRLLRAGHRVDCLIRAAGAAAAQSRLDQILDAAQPEPLTPAERQRANAVLGDLESENLGLQTVDLDRIASSVDRIIHGAASVDWNLPLDRARAINLRGTERVIALAQEAARRGALKKFDYISTCHVCGRRQGRIPEEDLSDSNGFFNSYEQSKFEAESAVRRSGLPYSVYRLSMVVGDSRTGYASSFKVMYWPLKMLSRGAFKIAPASPDGLIDIVPVDYVCDAIELLSAAPGQQGRTFHLAAGPGRNSTIAAILDLAVELFKIRRPVLIPARLFSVTVRPFLMLLSSPKQREQMKKGRVYLPYTSFKAEFDTSQVRALTDPAGLAPPPVATFFRRLVEYALATDWGKKSPQSAATMGV